MNVRHLLWALCLLAGSVLAEPGVTEQQIVIGQSISLDKGSNPYAVAALRGIQLYFDKTNAEGGIHGRKLVLRTLDDEKEGSHGQSQR